MGSTMKIGALAKSVDCHVETVRYYEKIGLIPPSIKASNGYGSYSENHLKILRLIRHAKSLGFSQQQIRELSQLATRQDNKCDDVYQMTITQLNFVDEKLKGLRRMRKALKNLSASCEQNLHESCPVLEQLASG